MERLTALTDSEDGEIVDAAFEALAMAQALSEFEDDEDDAEESPGLDVAHSTDIAAVVVSAAAA